MKLRYRCKTVTGSEYVITECDDKFYLRANNVPNPLSEKIEGEWEIEKPHTWPPVTGTRMVLVPPLELYNDYDNPARIPGGGKVTSLVVDVELIQEAE